MTLESLASMEYPGRFILVGKTDFGSLAVGYGLTGRSGPSKARELLEGQRTNTVRTNPTDPKELENGSPALLVYPAIAFQGNYAVASNGAQTKLLYSALKKGLRDGGFWHPSPEEVIKEALKEPVFEYDSKEDRWIDITTFEPDKYHTPRINLVANPQEACLHIVKEFAGRRHDEFFSFGLENKVGKFISTYNGPSEPIPFQGEPRNISIPVILGDAAQEVFHSLNPQYRVSVAYCWVHPAAKVDVCIKK